MVDQIPVRSPSFSRTLADCNGVWPSIRWFTDKGMSDDAKSLIERDLRSSVRIDNEKRHCRLEAFSLYAISPSHSSTMSGRGTLVRAANFAQEEGGR